METLLKFYLATHLLIAASYLIFKGVQHLQRSLKISMSYLTMNRMGQVLLFSSLVLPLVFAMVPLHSVPDIKVEVRSPLDGILQSPVLAPHLRNNVDADHAALISAEEAFPSLNVPFLILLGAGVVTVLALTRLTRRLLQLRKIMHGAHLLRQVGRVRILVSDVVQIPFSTLVGGVSVVVAGKDLEDFSSLRLIVRHELHHHRNGDTAWVLFIEILSCFFFLNPIMGCWKREISEIQEFACDEMLIGQMRVSPQDYGKCLLTIAESSLGAGTMRVGTTCMGASPRGPHQHTSFLRRRIEMFQQHKLAPRKSASGIIMGTLAILASASVAYASQKSLRETTQVQPNPGSVRFSPEIQALSEGILKSHLASFKARGGFIIVSDPKTGKILAAADSLPDKKPHWALSYKIEPASLLKPLYNARALDLKLVRSDEMLNCEKGKFNYAGQEYTDWKAMGTLSVTEALAQSSNICGIKIADRLGARGLQEVIHEFGFGSSGTATHFPQALPGNSPAAAAISADQYIPLVALGYSGSSDFYATPLEIVQAYGMIANDGKLLMPTPFDGKSGKERGQILSKATAGIMKDMLAQVVEKGTASAARSPLYSMAGKTSTTRSMAGFAGFAPVQDPRVVVYVGIIDPTNAPDGRPHGGEHAAPVFRAVVEQVLAKMGVASDR